MVTPPPQDDIMTRLERLREEAERANKTFKEETDRLASEADAIIKEFEESNLEQELKNIERDAVEQIKIETLKNIEQTSREEEAEEYKSKE